VSGIKFNRGEQFDYTNATFHYDVAYRDGDGFGLATIKQEGQPIRYDQGKWIGVVSLGNWWSIEIRLWRLTTRFRYRSWTKNIFYIAWE
jgi:hypothetical protein